jgi:hypothetical protein
MTLAVISGLLSSSLLSGPRCFCDRCWSEVSFYLLFGLALFTRMLLTFKDDSLLRHGRNYGRGWWGGHQYHWQIPSYGVGGMGDFYCGIWFDDHVEQHF